MINLLLPTTANCTRETLILFPSLGHEPEPEFKRQMNRTAADTAGCMQPWSNSKLRRGKKVSKHVMFWPVCRQASSGPCQIYKTAAAYLACMGKSLRKHRRPNTLVSSYLLDEQDWMARSLCGVFSFMWHPCFYFWGTPQSSGVHWECKDDARRAGPSVAEWSRFMTSTSDKNKLGWQKRDMFFKGKIKMHSLGPGDWWEHGSNEF